jgi:predicted regulator of amino acid metabolism with ACT domain
MVENPVQSSNPQFVKDHEALEDKISKFVKSFRSNRKEVFKITEYIIDSEKLPNILKS